MGMHLISILGTSLYEPVIYVEGENTDMQKPQEYIQAALISQFAEELKNGGKVTIFLTENAKKRNWENREYSEFDKSMSSRWNAQEKEKVNPGNIKKGLQMLLQEEYPEIQDRIFSADIPNAQSKDEIWDVFEAIFDSIEEEDEIIFDITHSFRSIPMLAITILNYAKIIKNCKVKGIYYGAYEAAKLEGEYKIAPIWNLSVYNEILEWTQAADAFMKYGDANQMHVLYDRKMKEIPNEEKRYWKPLKQQIAAMDDLSSAIATCRGSDYKQISGRLDAKKSIKNAYTMLALKSTEESKNKAREIKPLYVLIEKAKDSYKKFDCPENYQIGCEVIRWSIQNNMTQQAFTALEETVKTYLCYKYGLDDKTEKTRDDIIGCILNGSVQFLRDNSLENEKDREELKYYLYNKDDRGKKNLAVDRIGEENKRICDEIIRTISPEYIKISMRVKNLRNDINHFGFREAPRDSNKFKIELENLFREFEKQIEEENK